MRLMKLMHSPSLVEYASEWLNTYKAGLRTNTRTNYQNIIKKFNKDNVPITKMTRKTYLNILDGETDYMKTRIALTLKQVVKCAIADGYLRIDSCESIFDMVKLPKCQSVSKRVLTSDETKAVYNAALPDREKAYLWIVFGCGLRREEALALTVDDITTNGLSINKTLIFKNGRGTIEYCTKSVNSQRIVPLPSFLEEYLKEYAKDKTYLFMNKNELFTIGAFQAMWKRIQKSISNELGYEFNLTSHSFRHNYCSNLCYQVPAISIGTIASLLGDTVNVVLNTYNHVISEREDRIGAIEKALDIF